MNTAIRPLARAICIALAAGVTGNAPAATDQDLLELRQQLLELKAQYERRIEALERRLEQAERSTARPAAASAGAAVPAEAPPAVAAAPAGGGRAAESAHNPAISLIVNGTYGNLSRDPRQYRINGFVPSGGEVAPPGRGFGLGESELVLSANIDTRFRGTLMAALAPDDSIAVEEGYIETLGLSHGLTLKAGRFKSAVGYQNEIHAHAWDFVDAPLAYKAFLGNQFADDGLQVKWIAPTDLYLDVGLELGRGRSFPAGPAGGRSKNGVGAATMFAHAGGDIGESTAWKLGLAHLGTRPEARSYDDTDSTGTTVSNAFTGRSSLWALGGVLKWAPGGNATVTNFKLQGEYFRRRETGTLVYDTGAASLGTLGGNYTSRQGGWYLQGVYQFMPEWRVGYRVDRLAAGTVSLGQVDAGLRAATDFPLLAAHSPTRHSLMTDWSGSEFSRVRLQLARDRSRANAPDTQFFVQYIMSLGAHGAHSF